MISTVGPPNRIKVWSNRGNDLLMSLLTNRWICGGKCCCCCSPPPPSSSSFAFPRFYHRFCSSSLASISSSFPFSSPLLPSSSSLYISIFFFFSPSVKLNVNALVCSLIRTPIQPKALSKKEKKKHINKRKQNIKLANSNGAWEFSLIIILKWATHSAEASLSPSRHPIPRLSFPDIPWFSRKKLAISFWIFSLWKVRLNETAP